MSHWEPTTIQKYVSYQVHVCYFVYQRGIKTIWVLGVVKDKGGLLTEKIKKTIQKIFKQNESDIIIQCNINIIWMLLST